MILDTTVLIAIERDLTRLDQVVKDSDDVAIAAVTGAELLVGVELANEQAATRRGSYVNEILSTVVTEVYDLDVARVHAELLAWTQRSGRPRGAHDLIIAATARARQRTVVTADGTGFERLPGVAVREA